VVVVIYGFEFYHDCQGLTGALFIRDLARKVGREAFVRDSEGLRVPETRP
jgi:hypothetical protein